MKSWKVTKLGEPEDVLQIQEVDKPTIAEGEVLIKVEASALNFFDILLCQGKYQEKPPIPFTPGAEISGVIEEVGPNSNFEVGTRVLATPRLPNGGLSEYVTAQEGAVYAIPDAMEASEAAALYITYQTTYFALFRSGRLKEGETLLVHAGSGGVGSAAIQLGKAFGAKVIATAGSEEKVQVCKDLGADIAINYREEDFVEIVNEHTGGRGADVIYDPVGGDVFHQSRRCINFEGRILIIGFAGGEIADAPTNHALVKNYSIVGVHWGYFNRLYPEKVRQNHEELMKLYEEGKIKPLVYKEYDFEEVPTALRELASRKTYGKLIVMPPK